MNEKLPDNLKEWNNNLKFVSKSLVTLKQISDISSKTINDISHILEDSNIGWLLKVYNNLSFDSSEELAPVWLDTLKIALSKSPEDIRNKIIEIVSKTSPITRWQEWEIYKIKLDWWKEYIVAKKRFDTESRYEFYMQKVAYNFSRKFNSWVKVPEILDEFQNWWSWYLLMEYVNWKTLDNMLWEWICKQHIIPKIERFRKSWNILYHRLESDISEFENAYWGLHDFEFKDDSDVESWVFHLLEILHELGDLDVPKPPRIAETDINNPTKANYPIRNNFLKKHIGKTIIFSERKWIEIHSKLLNFLRGLHWNWFYHRDIWGNYRNLMFSVNDKWEYTPYLIDFWVSVYWKWSEDNVYSNPIEIRNYYNDNAILEVIKNVTWELELKENIDKNKLTIIKWTFFSCINNKSNHSWYFKLNTKRGKTHEEGILARNKLKKIIETLNDEEKNEIIQFLKEKLDTISSNDDLIYKYAKVFWEYIWFEVDDYI